MNPQKHNRHNYDKCDWWRVAVEKAKVEPQAPPLWLAVLESECAKARANLRVKIFNQKH